MAAQFGQVIEGQGINERQRAFLLAAAREMTVAAAARASGIQRRDHYRWLGEPGYRVAFDQARESAAQFFMAEAFQRCEQWRAEHAERDTFGIFWGKKGASTMDLLSMPAATRGGASGACFRTYFTP